MCANLTECEASFASSEWLKLTYTLLHIARRLIWGVYQRLTPSKQGQVLLAVCHSATC